MLSRVMMGGIQKKREGLQFQIMFQLFHVADRIDLLLFLTYTSEPGPFVYAFSSVLVCCKTNDLHS